jgi:hypothetical protein
MKDSPTNGGLIGGPPVLRRHTAPFSVFRDRRHYSVAGRKAKADRMKLRIFLEFVGGAWDGMNLCNDSHDPAEVGLALLTFTKTHDAEIGSTVVMPADYAVRDSGADGYKYVVTNRTVLGNEILARLECCQTEVSEPNTCMAKRIVLQFEGGHLHGRCFDSQSPDTNVALLAVAYYCFTDQGTVGHGLAGLPATPLLRERRTPGDAGEYRVAHRIEDAEQVVVRFKHQERNGTIQGAC